MAKVKSTSTSRRSPSGLGAVLGQSEWLTVLVLVAAVSLIRVPLRFEWFGEQDQARFLVDAILYHFEGGEIVRKYYILTSPLSLAVFARLAGFFGNDSLLQISNGLGVLAGTLTSVAVYALSRTFGLTRLWAAAVAFGSSLVPGVFMTSLYGYPSVYALPFGIAAAAAVSYGVTRDCARARLRWLIIGGVAFALFVLLKIDFALFGTVLLGVVVLQRRITVSNIAALAVMAVVTGLITLVFVGSMLPDWREAFEFGSGWNRLHQPYQKLITDLGTLWLTVGIGTLALLAAGFIVLYFRSGFRSVAVLLIAWLISVGPIWTFWGSIPPISTRHALPGALFTAVIVGLIAGRLFPRRRVAALLFPAVLVLGNWLWGGPAYDLNYNLGGNLVESYRVNRRAFAACRILVDRIVALDKPVQISFGSPAHPDILGNISVTPMVRYELAARASRVRNRSRSHYHLQTARPDGQQRLFFACTERDINAVLDWVTSRFSASDVSVYSLTTDYPQLADHGIDLTRFDLQREYDRLNDTP